jgi:hypothetical protein
MAIFVARFNTRGPVVVDHDGSSRSSRSNNNSRDYPKAEEASYQVPLVIV